MNEELAMVDPDPEREHREWKESAPGRWLNLAEMLDDNRHKGSWRQFKDFQYWFERYGTHIVLSRTITINNTFEAKDEGKIPTITTFVDQLGVFSNLNSLARKLTNLLRALSKSKPGTHSHGVDMREVFLNTSAYCWDGKLEFRVGSQGPIYRAMYMEMDNTEANVRYAESSMYECLDINKLRGTWGDKFNSALDEA